MTLQLKVNFFTRLASSIALILSFQTANFAQDTKTLANKVIPSTVSIKFINSQNGGEIQGSAFSIGKGKFVTNFHVIALGKEGFIQKSAKDTLKIPIKNIYAFDVDHDLAIVEIDTMSVPALEIMEQNLEVGEKVFVCGNPLGLTGTFSDGIVSANRKIENNDVIQITAPISSGSSGGPVINEKGKVIGVIFSTIMDGQNLNFVIPGKYLKQLIAKGSNSYELPWYNFKADGEKLKTVFSTKLDTKEELKFFDLKLDRDKNAVLKIEKESERRAAFGYLNQISIKPNFKLSAEIKVKKENESCFYWGDLTGLKFSGVEDENKARRRFFYLGICAMNNSAWVELISHKGGIVKQKPIALNINMDDYMTYSYEKIKDTLYLKIGNQLVYKERFTGLYGKFIGVGGHGPLEIHIKELKQQQDQVLPNTSSEFANVEVITNKRDNLKSLLEYDEVPLSGFDESEQFYTKHIYNKSKNIQMRESEIWKYNSKTVKSEKDEFLSDGKNNYLFSVSPNSNVFFMERTDKENDIQSSHGLYVYNKNTRIKTDFPTIEKFYKYSSYSVYFLSHDGQFLISSLKRYDTFGNEDLYVSKRKPDGTYTAPLNLGPIINTEFQEQYSCMTPDNKYLFFISDGHGNYGKGDIFVSERLDSTWFRWSKPVNVGNKVNSDEFESNVTIHPMENIISYKRYSKEKDNSTFSFKIPKKYTDGYSVYQFDMKKASANSNVQMDVYENNLWVGNALENNNKILWAFTNGKKYKLVFKQNEQILKEKELSLEKVKEFELKTIEW